MWIRFRLYEINVFTCLNCFLFPGNDEKCDVEFCHSILNVSTWCENCRMKCFVVWKTRSLRRYNRYLLGISSFFISCSLANENGAPFSNAAVSQYLFHLYYHQTHQEFAKHMLSGGLHDSFSHYHPHCVLKGQHSWFPKLFCYFFLIHSLNVPEPLEVTRFPSFSLSQPL